MSFGNLCVALWALAFMALSGGLFASSRAHTTPAQNDATVKAQLSTGLCKLGEVPQLKLQVENARSAGIVGLPKVEGLTFGEPLGPNRSAYKESRGGRTVIKSSIHWLVPIGTSELGEFEIPPIRMEVDGAEIDVRVSPSSLKVVKDLDAAKLGLIAMPDMPERVYEGQPFLRTIRVGFAKRLRVQASLSLPWWDTQSGVMEVQGPGFSKQPRRPQVIQINRRYERPFEILQAEIIDGEEFVILEYQSTIVATRSGTLEYPTSTFRFAEILDRARSPFREPRMREYFATLDPFSIEVLPVPEEGRPFAWGGAVGDLVADRRVSSRDVAAGETLQLEVTWTGMANTEFFDAPDLKKIEAFEGFRVLGSEDEHLGMERRVVYELVPLSSEVTEVPKVPLWLFRPSTGKYELVETEPVPIRVSEGDALDLSAAFGESSDSEDKMDLVDIASEWSGAREQKGPAGSWILALGAVTGLGWWFLRKQVRLHGDPASHRARNRRTALAQLKKRLAHPGGPEPTRQALHQYLAVRSDERPEAWVGRDVVAFARTRDWPSAAMPHAERLQSILTTLDEAIYDKGGAASQANPPAHSDLLSTLNALAKEGVL